MRLRRVVPVGVELQGRGKAGDVPVALTVICPALLQKKNAGGHYVWTIRNSTGGVDTLPIHSFSENFHGFLPASIFPMG